MLLAAIYDIHGNLPALEAVLEEIRHAGVDQIVVGGDVLPGPMPRETLECLLSLKIPTQFLYGNGDRAVLEFLAGKGFGTLPDPAREAVQWTAQQLNAEDERILRSWPKTLTVNIGGNSEVLFCHATPRNDTEIFTRLTPEEPLAPVFAGVDATMVVCGHTHMPFDRTIGTIRILNAGSVGMPFGKPGADWLLLGDKDVRLRHTIYDLEGAAGRIRATRYPGAEDFAHRYVLQVPSEEEMLKMFARAELRG